MKITPLVFFLLFATLVRGQSCGNGLGDPIVNITFGSGANFGPALAHGITNLNYQSSACVLDNAYEIVNSVSGCYPGDWVTVNADHTGNPNGYFMLIGAADPPSDFFLDTVSGLCGSTSYQFAAWVLNMASHSGEILPDITFSIGKPDGTVLGNLQTGGIPWNSTVNWVQYSFYFTTPPGVTAVVLRMKNNAPGGYGNDLALDDITFRTSGPSIGVTINGHSGDTVTLCSGPANLLQFLGTVGSCYASTAYQWQESTDNGGSWNNIPAAMNTTYTAFPTTKGNYLYRLAAAQTGNIGLANCQVVSGADTIVVLPAANPAISIQMDSSYICAGQPAVFTATPTDGGPAPVYQWMLNGSPVGSGGPAYRNNTLDNGDQVSCILTGDAICMTNATASSNILSLNVLPEISSSISITSTATSICQDSMVTFTATSSNGGTHPAYQWMVNGWPAGGDSPIFASPDFNEGDEISIVMTGDLPCSSPATSNTITMTVYSKPAVSLPPDTVIEGHTSIRLDPAVSGSVTSWQWSPATWLNDPGSLDPVASPIGDITYQLTVTNSLGCTATAKETVSVFYELSMPNAFTPNGDGRNDLYRIPPSVPVNIRLFAIYNRWGALVFSTADSGAGWDGRFGGQAQPAGVYVWMIDYYNPILKRQERKNGTVMLVR
jgi:gliding motility-associated-like protein